MARGGARPNAGRKPGVPTRMNEEARAKAAEGGIMPLDYLLELLRDDAQTQDVRIDAAKAAAPYVHARLAAIEHSGDLTMRHEDALDELDDQPGTGNPPAAEE